MAAEKRTRAKRFAQAIADCSDEQYEIKPLTEWRKVDRANILKDGCLHWEIGDSYGIAQKGKWRSVK